MIDTVSTHGNAYTSDKDYSTFFGPPRELTYYDWGLRAYVKATVQTPKTPHDRVAPASEDAAITPQAGDYDLFDHRQQGLARRRVNADVIRRECLELLRDKPLNTTQIAERLGYSQLGVARFFQHKPAGFVQVARTLHGPLWGIEGVEYGTVYGGAMERIVAYLSERESATAAQICAACAISYSTFGYAMREHPGTLRCVEVGKVGHRLWALAEKHDTEASA